MTESNRRAFFRISAHDLLVWALFALAYSMTSSLSFLFISGQNGVSPIWPSSGLALAVLLLSKPEQRKPILVIIFLTHLGGAAVGMLTLAEGIGFGITNSLQAFLGFWFIDRLGGSRITFTKIREVLALVGVAVFVNWLTSILGAIISSSHYALSFRSSLFAWWMADTLGTLLVTPLIVTWAANPKKFQKLSLSMSIEALFLTLAFILVMWFVVVQRGEFAKCEFIHAYLVFPILIWSALRFRPRATTVMIFVTAIFSIWFVFLGYGEPGASAARIDEILGIEGLLAVSSISTLLLSAMMAELKARQHFVEEGAERNNAVIRTAMDGFWMADSDGNFIMVNDAYCRMSGYSRDELLSMGIVDIESAESREETWARIQHVKANGFARFESVHRRRDGRTFDVEVNVRYLAHEDKFPVFIRDITDQKQADENLKVSEARYRALFSQAHDAVFILDLEGRHILSNQRAADMLGYTLAELQRLSFRDTSADISQSEEMMKRLLQGEHIPLYERRFRKKNGDIVYTEINAELVRDDKGTPLHIQSVVRDITERKKTEKALRRHAEEMDAFQGTLLKMSSPHSLPELLNSIVEHAARLLDSDSGGLYLTEPEHRRARCVVSYNTLRDYTGTALDYGEGSAGYVAETGKSLIIDDYRTWPGRSIKYESDQPFMAVMSAPLIWQGSVTGVIHVLRNNEEEGKFTGEDLGLLEMFAKHAAVAVENARLYNSIQQELTERRIAEAALRESELKYRALAENMPNVVYRCQNDSRYALIYLNDAIEELTGYPKEEFLENGLTILDLIHPEDLPNIPIPTPTSSSTINRRPYHVTYRIRHKSGEWRWVDERGVGVLNPQDDVEYLEGVMIDITERRQRERETESLLEISQSLGGTLELIPLLENILNAAVRAIPDAEKGTILLLTDGENLEIKAVVGYADPRVNGTLYSPACGYAAKTLRDRRPLLIPDVRSDECARYDGEIDEMRSVLSAMAVPLIVQDHVIGVIAIDNCTREGAFSTENLQLLTTFSTSAALAIENARLFDETRQRLAELEALHSSSASLRVAHTSDEALPIMLNKTLEALDTDAGMILLYNAAENELRYAVKRGWFEQLDTAPLKPGEGIAGEVFASGQAHISTEFVNDPLTYLPKRGQIPAGWGGACVPIRTALEAIGVLFVGVPLPRQVSAEQLKLLISLAEMTGSTLHRMQLYEETSRRAEVFATLYQTNVILSGAYDLETLLQTIVDQATRLLGASAGTMYLYDPVTEELENTYATDPSLKVGVRVHLGEGMAGRVAMTHMPLRVDDYSNWENRLEKYDKTPLGAVLEVPMLFGGELIGVLVVEEFAGTARTFTEADERLLSLLAAQAAGAVRSARLLEETVRRLKHIQTLRSIDRAITANMDSNVTLKILLGQALNLMNISAASILLFNPNTLTLEYAMGQGFRTKDIELASVRLGESYAGRAVFDRRIMNIPDLSVVAAGPFRDFVQKESFVSYHIAPMIAKGHMRGVLEVYSRGQLAISSEWLELLDALATQAAIAVDNAQMFHDLQRANFELTVAYDAAIEGWSQSLDARHRENKGHAKRVAEWTVQLARAAGIEEKQIVHIRRGALLHDIGNTDFPEYTPLDEQKLSSAEREMIHRHPGVARDIFNHIQFLRPAMDIPYCHHEKWDGSGYPRGLKGDQIPFAARIFAVLDMWDFLTHSHAGRRRLSGKKAIDRIKARSGKDFDPEVVELLIKHADLLDEGEE